MRTSLHETERLERFILRKQSPGERLLMEATILLDPALAQQAEHQQMVYQIVHSYGRERLREEIAEIEQVLFTAPRHHSFRQRILNLFK